MKEIKAIIQPFMLNPVLDELHQMEGLPGVTVSEVRGISVQPGHYEQVVKIKLEIIVPNALAEIVAQAIQKAAHTGHAGDGRVFVIPVERAISIQTGEQGEETL